MNKNTYSEQVERILYFENIMQDVLKLLETDDMSEDDAARLRNGIAALSEYYGSTAWKQDYAADEAGMFPADLPRGVLSEDGIYNVLEQYRDLVNGDICEELFRLRDRKYGAFQAKLIPNIDPETIIGVRTPALRAMAKRLKKDYNTAVYLRDLPHRYFEENQLHAFIISEEKDFDRCMECLEAFLPYVDNWATCDQLSPGILRKHTVELLPFIRKWIRSEETYTIRFGIGMLMKHYLDAYFDPEYPALVASVRSEEYYVNMMIAWYFATALAKQYEAVISYIEEQKLEIWTHNKAIQKCVESRRISPEQKEYLRGFTRKG
ncbi:MAG: DUF4298 domain-containing protein [Eubacterium sp.]|nr:DUF4298 domain-containing protein [Eubacterium sp.]